MDFLIQHKQFHVYLDKRLSNGSVFYVGKGNNLRVSNLSRSNKHWNYTVAKEGGFKREIIFSTLIESEAFAKEKEFISFYGRSNLCNKTDGGEGTCGNKFVMSDVHKSRISTALKGNKNGRGCKGNKIPEKQKLAISKKLTGTKLPQSVKDKISKSLLGNQRARKLWIF